MDTQVEKTTQSLTSAAEMRETTQMLMQPNANWEAYLAPVPLSIAILGELVFISSCGDFSINKNPPKDGYKYIKHPDSFRACLMQICNSGWHAFNEAHKNMDQIRIHTGIVPDYMKAAVNILFNDSDEVINTLLPNQLKNIRTIADDCMTLADSVEKKFSDVINLIHELLEACVKARHLYGEELKKMKLKETELREQDATKLKEQSIKAAEAMSKQVEETQEAYKKAMDSLPSGWKMVAMDFVEGLASGVTALMKGFTFMMTAPVNKVYELVTYQNKGDEEADVIPKVSSKSEVILSLARSLKVYVVENEIDWNELYDQKNKYPRSTWTENEFKRIHKELTDMSKDKLCHKALSLCERGITICQELAKYTPGKKWNKKMTKQMIKKIKQLNDDALAFDSKSKRFSGSPALTPKPPMMFKTENNSGHRSASERATENAHFRIEQSRKQLQQARKAYEKRMEDMVKNQRELTNILVEMQNCKLTEIDFNKTIEMLKKGLTAMGSVKEQWEKMVHFFQMVSNIIKTSLSGTLHDFVKTTDDTKKLSYSQKLFTKDLLYSQAFQASNIASLVHMISGTYTEVSNKYLMDRVSSLGRLMTLDNDQPEFLHERLKLQDSCKAAQEGILQLVLKNKEEFERKSDARMLKIEGELKAILPADPPQETDRIREIVQAMLEGEDYYC
ncbi:uncharacterized protein [Trachinotus anak]|uniref:uncharacterized protein n=1 Tax=Trachinotus anak TaxID=443729 RepID=UPI0039F21548